MKKKLSILLLAVSTVAISQTAGPVIPRVYYASKSGATLDCIVVPGQTNTGKTATGGTCTNNDAILNSILALATASNPIVLILDGGTITEGIAGPANGHWTLDCQNRSNGIFMAAGSNSHGIRNIPAKNTWTWGIAPGTPGMDITIQNCLLNMNRGNGTTGDSNSGNPSWGPGTDNWLFGIYMDNVNRLRLIGNWIYDSPTFAIHINTSTDFVADANRVEQISGALYEDGIHMSGIVAQGRITNNWLTTSDDGIAINPAEGYLNGSATDIYMGGNECGGASGCFTALRLVSNEYAGPYGPATVNAPISRIIFEGGSGTILSSNGGIGVAFRIGEVHPGSSTADIIQSVKLLNSTYTLPSTNSNMTEVRDNTGELMQSGLTWMSPAGANPWLTFANAATISSYSSTNCRIIRNTAGNAAAYWGTIPGSGYAIKRLEENGVSVEDEQGQTYSAPSYDWDIQSGALVTYFVMTAHDPTKNPTFLNGNEWAQITNFYGNGVSIFFRNVLYSALPPASFTGLSASISDSASLGVWGATETGGSAGHYAQLTSDGANWTVTGK